MLLYFPSKSLHVAILRRGALQMGLPTARLEKMSKELLFIQRIYQYWMVSPGSSSSSWGYPDGAPPSQAGKRSKESLFIQRIYKYWIVSPGSNSSSWGSPNGAPPSQTRKWSPEPFLNTKEEEIVGKPRESSSVRGKA